MNTVDISPDMAKDFSDTAALTPSIFTNERFGKVRTLVENGTVLFCGSDVAKALGYERPNQAIMAHCKDTVKRSTLTNGGKQAMLYIFEGDIYRLVARSKLPEAEKFERWVFDEVLPAIRKYGMYATPAKVEEILADPDVMIGVLQAFKTEQQARKEAEAALGAAQKKINADAPIVRLGGILMASNKDVSVQVLADLVSSIGIPMGRNQMFQYLRDIGHVCYKKVGTQMYNAPYAAAIKQGYLKIIEKPFQPTDGEAHLGIQTLVTPRGQEYYINRLRNAFRV